MMQYLDAFSVYVMVALVVNVCGIVFIVETLLRRDGGSGRVWSLSFLSSMLMTISYVIWYSMHDAWWAIAVGNGAIVAAGGLLWLGCRQYNGRGMRWATWVVVCAVAVVVGSVVIAGPDGGDWAGALWMFAGVCGFAAAGAIECARGDIAAQRTAWVLAGILVVQFLYFVARISAFVTSGPDGALFDTWFGTTNTGMLTVIVSIIALVVTSVLRAARAPVRGYDEAPSAVGIQSGILSTADFRAALQALCARAEARGDIVGVICVRVGDLDQISTAFGSEVVRSITTVWRDGVRTHAPSSALVGGDGAPVVSVGVVVVSPAEARRQAGAIYRGLFDELGTVSGGVIPVIGVGIGLSVTVGYDPDALLALADEAADEASRSVESSVLVGGAEEG